MYRLSIYLKPDLHPNSVSFGVFKVDFRQNNKQKCLQLLSPLFIWKILYNGQYRKFFQKNPTGTLLKQLVKCTSMI